MTITRLSPARYRLVGQPTDPQWLAFLRPNHEPWCEVTLGSDGNVAGFGGEVWPAAWPELFACRPGTAHVPVDISLTPAGRAAFDAAR